MKPQPGRGIPIGTMTFVNSLFLFRKHTHGAAILANMVTKTVTCAASTYVSHTSPKLDMLGHTPKPKLLLLCNATQSHIRPSGGYCNHNWVTITVISVISYPYISKLHNNPYWLCLSNVWFLHQIRRYKADSCKVGAPVTSLLINPSVLWMCKVNAYFRGSYRRTIRVQWSPQ